MFYFYLDESPNRLTKKTCQKLIDCLNEEKTTHLFKDWEFEDELFSENRILAISKFSDNLIHATQGWKFSESPFILINTETGDCSHLYKEVKIINDKWMWAVNMPSEKFDRYTEPYLVDYSHGFKNKIVDGAKLPKIKSEVIKTIKENANLGKDDPITDTHLFMSGFLDLEDLRSSEFLDTDNLEKINAELNRRYKVRLSNANQMSEIQAIHESMKKDKKFIKERISQARKDANLDPITNIRNDLKEYLANKKELRQKKLDERQKIIEEKQKRAEEKRTKRMTKQEEKSIDRFFPTNDDGMEQN